jgi:hypothetical protein
MFQTLKSKFVLEEVLQLHHERPHFSRVRVVFLVLPLHRFFILDQVVDQDQTRIVDFVVVLKKRRRRKVHVAQKFVSD